MKNKSVVELLLERELVDSEPEAQELIENDAVLVDGLPVRSVDSLAEPDAKLEIISEENQWVGRGARKLWPFLEKDWLRVEGEVCIDVGASTGGFTEALLKAGAKKVYAVDVGYGQLAYRLRNDEQVVCMDRFNFRYAEKADFAPRPAIFTMDVSFISTEKLLPALNRVMVTGSRGILLLKPQFEARREENTNGVIESEQLRKEIKNRVLEKWKKQGWQAEQVAPAPVKGDAAGNQEFVVKMVRST